MSYAAYKVLHLLGVLLLFTSIGGLCALAMTASSSELGRRISSIAHGVALLLTLVAGFGILAKLGLSGSWPLWVWLKLAIWIALGGIVVVIRRLPKYATLFLFLLPILGALAGYLAIYKVGSGG